MGRPQPSLGVDHVAETRNRHPRLHLGDLHVARAIKHRHRDRGTEVGFKHQPPTPRHMDVLLLELWHSFALVPNKPLSFKRCQAQK